MQQAYSRVRMDLVPSVVAGQSFRVQSHVRNVPGTRSGPWAWRVGRGVRISRYPATSATIPPDIHHLQHVGDKVIVGTRTEGVHTIEDTRVNETCPGHTQCTCLSVTSTRLELCGPGADRSPALWHVVVIVGPDVDTRAHALGRCRASCGFLRL